VLDVVVNKPFKHLLCRLYGKWLLSGICPLTPAGNIRRPSEALLGITFHHNPSSRDLKSAVCQTI
jgi:hypothetical protein